MESKRRKSSLSMSSGDNERDFDIRVTFPFAMILFLSLLNTDSFGRIMVGRLIFITVLSSVLLLWATVLERVRYERRSEMIKASPSMIPVGKALLFLGNHLSKLDDYVSVSPKLKLYLLKLKQMEERNQMETYEYDTLHVIQSVTKLLGTRTAISFFHLTLGVFNPLIVSSLVAVSWVFDDPTVRIYFLHKTEEEPDLPRPFDIESSPAYMLNNYKELGRRISKRLSKLKQH
mmetsp:Transcript_58/g.66  ORF Transcript_58/g.66 Transcript_58/m.66 type:complete len:232 (+) Transcript_58:219-914(+)